MFLIPIKIQFLKSVFYRVLIRRLSTKKIYRISNKVSNIIFKYLNTVGYRNEIFNGFYYCTTGYELCAARAGDQAWKYQQGTVSDMWTGK
jgi:hypothetical protein